VKGDVQFGNLLGLITVNRGSHLSCQFTKLLTLLIAAVPDRQVDGSHLHHIPQHREFRNILLGIKQGRQTQLQQSQRIGTPHDQTDAFAPLQETDGRQTADRFPGDGPRHLVFFRQVGFGHKKRPVLKSFRLNSLSNPLCQLIRLGHLVIDFR